MREIKFRAWDAENKEMAPVVEMLFNQYGGIDTRTSRRMDINEDCLGKNSLMQYTGLLDKNGKECYEGDLVKHPQYPTPLRVEWDYDQWGLFDGMCNEASFDKDCEIVGNIYEHEHLLK